MLKLDGIICPRKANSFQNYLVCFFNYMQEGVLKMSNLELFLFFNPVDYINTILIQEANMILNDLLDLGYFMRWFGY